MKTCKLLMYNNLFTENTHMDTHGMEAVATRLHLFLTEIGISEAYRGRDVQQKFGWTQSQYAKTLTGGQYPTIAMMQELRSKHGMNIGWLLTGLGSMRTQPEEMECKSYCMVQNAIFKHCHEHSLAVQPRNLEKVIRVVHRNMERTQVIDTELIADLLS